ncbi:MAG: hypothetical protein KJ015_05035 [Myxococcales bacterium]|nr:hypothetical protein [Sorangiineae bacterium PRO1]MCL4749498.1 hypothetical protein [Myxococcales bacterium]
MLTTLEDLLSMSNAERFAIVERALPLDLEALADTTYTGVDLSMPALFHRLFWKSFRKTFHRDPVSGRLRGWNVKVEQTGWGSAPAPKRDRAGKPLTFGHYEVRSATGLRFPRGWKGEHYLDYRDAGNRFGDFPARTGYCPLVSVNPGRSDLLLGWEVFNLGGLLVPLNDFWALVREGPLRAEDVVPRPDGA